jgi:predicted DCC family thiol-disulfide oxidoreductase YuxK
MLLVFDADCGFCARFARSALVRSARARPIGSQAIAGDPALAGIVRERGIDPRIFARAMVLIDDERVLIGARAFNALLHRSGGWRAALALALSCPLVLALETLVYRAIAAQRRRISICLGTRACTLVSPSPLDSPGGSKS